MSEYAKHSPSDSMPVFLIRKIIFKINSNLIKKHFN